MAGPWEQYGQSDGPWKKYAEASPPAQVPEAHLMDQVKQQAGNALGGLVRGAGSIGATILWPVDKATDMIKGDRALGLTSLVTGKAPLSRNEERRIAMDEGLRSLGADPESLAFKVGKFGGEVAGTAGTGGALAKGAQAIGAAPTVVSALSSGGLSGGGNMLTRIGAGATSGAVSSGLVNPQDAMSGAVLGSLLPPGVKAFGAAGQKLSDMAKNSAQSLMQSAVKPTIAQLKSGDAGVAVDTLLKYGLTPNQKGVDTLRGLINDKNQQISDLIRTSNASIDKSKVASYLGDTKAAFGRQVSPTSDLAAIDNVANDFLAHPMIPGSSIPVQAAQDMKQGTYKVLAKKYGQMGGAETEAQKSLARGLKDEIAAAVPEVAPLNAEESRLLSTLKVTERRALMDLNKNPVGLAALATNPASFAAFMADRSAGFKALAARQVNKLATPGLLGQKLPGLLESPGVRTGLLLTSGS
jgi:hypothetical protein